MNHGLSPYLFVMLVMIGLSGCWADSNNDNDIFLCENPAPLGLGGERNVSALGFIVYFKESVDTTAEVTRLSNMYTMQVGVIYEATPGFYALMSDEVMEQLRCESTVASVHYNGAYSPSM
jgi:hypothetical protein